MLPYSLVVHIISPSAAGALSGEMSPVLQQTPTRVCGLVLFSFTWGAHGYFLVLQNTPGSSCVFPRINHFSKEPWLLLLENGVRNQDRGAGVLVATQVTFPIGAPADKPEE